MFIVHPGPSLRGDSVSVYVDESRHDHLGFVLSAFVCSTLDLERPVEDALRSVGLTPGVDEFKSGELMVANERIKILRGKILGLAVDRTRVAVLITSTKNWRDLGHDLIRTLEMIVRRNGFRFPTLHAHFDRGLFASREESYRLASGSHTLKTARLHFEQDSRHVLGLQVADAVAHVAGQVLKEQIIGIAKGVDIGGDGTGYDDGTKAPLGWSLLMTIRYSFFVRPHLAGRAPVAEELPMEPVLIPDENNMDSIMDASQHPELIGWGAFLAPDLSGEIKIASEAVFSRLWLGCIH